MFTLTLHLPHSRFIQLLDTFELFLERLILCYTGDKQAKYWTRSLLAILGATSYLRHFCWRFRVVLFCDSRFVEQHNSSYLRLAPIRLEYLGLTFRRTMPQMNKESLAPRFVFSPPFRFLIFNGSVCPLSFSSVPAFLAVNSGPECFLSFRNKTTTPYSGRLLDR